MMPDPRDAIDDYIEEEAERRAREKLRREVGPIIARLESFMDAPGQEDAGDYPMSERVTRAEATRMFGISMSKIRTLEKNGAVSVWPKGGRKMVHPAEVAKALGVQVPKGER